MGATREPSSERSRVVPAPSLRTVDPLVGRVVQAEGRPLDGQTRRQFEALFQQRFDDVRVHSGGEASESARALGARAYTVGRHIVFRDAPEPSGFAGPSGPWRHEPGSAEGQRLLAHELAHVLQQRAAGSVAPGLSQPGDAAEAEAERVADMAAGGRSAPHATALAGPSAAVLPVRARPVPAVQRAADFSSEYKSRDGQVRSRSQTYEDYKSGLAPTTASSESGGHALKGDLEKDELLAVFKAVSADVAANPALVSTVDAYVRSLNQAFRVLRIDTVEAQASYIANAFVESAQFRFMTETEGSLAGAKPYQSDPSKVRLATSWLDEVAKDPKDRNPKTAKQFESFHGYEAGGSINTGNWGRSFIGRGPIQVTHRYNYVQVIAILEHRFEELPPGSPDAAFLREAIDKIKGDPSQVSNPKYAFLFSAGFMRMKAPDKLDKRGRVESKGLRGDEAANRGNVTGWMGPQLPERAKEKRAAYDEARVILMKRHKREQAAAEASRHEMSPAQTEQMGRREFWELDVKGPRFR